MFSAPEKIVAQLGIEDGEIVADFGAGSGVYTIAVASTLHGTGKVYAVDVQKDLLTRLQNTCTEKHLGNVSFIWGNIELPGGAKIREQSCSLVIVSNVLFQTSAKKAVIDEAKRVLIQSGRLLVVDWTGSFNNMGPTPEQVFTEIDARKLVEASTFTFEKNVDAGNYHYGLVFRKGLYHGSAKQY